MSDSQQEYADALAGYRDALARLQEAKRHIPPSPRDRFRQREREKRAAERERYQSPECAAELNRITAKALAILHKKVNDHQRIAEEAGAKPGDTLRIRLPVTYRIIPPNDE
jgi:hypothetical protein